jgi:phenylalanyl-tRNA synthetase beta chain
MRISLHWLRDYIQAPLQPDEIAATLTDIGLEVEKVEPYESLPGGLSGVVVGHVLSLTQHPDADRLRVTTVDIGTGDPLQIVCGAPNVAKGQKVLVATAGTHLPGAGKGGPGPLIKKSKIRGVESHGMICAQDELGIGHDHSGILVLPADAVPGTSAAAQLGLYTDHVLEIGLTPNRTDAFGHYGVARDLAARLNRTAPTEAKLPAVPTFGESHSPAPIAVHIEQAEACHRYAGITLSDVQIGPSPEWLRNRLLAVGINPINNVVDITNYVMHETGQPLHAFDAAAITTGRVVVKTLPEGTPFTTLDGVQRTLGADDLMVCNDHTPMCIAGVYGGAESGVSATTTSVFLESAWFHPSWVRRTARRHALHTDASFRFERGADPAGVLYALQRAAALMVELCGATPQGPMVMHETAPITPARIDFSLKKCNALCGTNIDHETLQPILRSLGFEIAAQRGDTYTLLAPTYRADVTRPADVAEEVLRIYGFNKVPMPERMQFSVSYPEKPSRHEVQYAVARTLVGRGFCEMMNLGLTRSVALHTASEAAFAERQIPVLNPLSQDLDILRPTLLTGALDTVAWNLNRQSERLMLFEIGAVYHREGDQMKEHKALCLVLTGNRLPENWNNTAAPFDGSDLAGHLAAALQVMGLHMTTAPGSQPMMQQALQVLAAGKSAGVLGLLTPAALKQYGVKKPIWAAEINLDLCLAQVQHAAVQYRELPKYPAVRRDFSLLLDRHVAFRQIEEIARKRGGKTLQDVWLFDVYEGKNLPDGKKSYAVAFALQDPDRTLNDKEIDRRMAEIQAALENELGAQLR